MLIDDFMPEYGFREKHDIWIGASRKKVFETLKTTNLCESTIVDWLLWLRGLPSGQVLLSDLGDSRFEILAESENREVLIGLAGKFWTPWGELQDVSADNFQEFDKPGFAKATWNFWLENENEGVRLKTETRIQTLDDASNWQFSIYWTVVRPFSGLIRKEILSLIKKNAESATDESHNENLAWG